MKTQHLEIFFSGYEPITNFRLQYQLAVSFLIYAILETRTDRAYAVSIIS